MINFVPSVNRSSGPCSVAAWLRVGWALVWWMAAASTSSCRGRAIFMVLIAYDVSLPVTGDTLSSIQLRQVGGWTRLLNQTEVFRMLVIVSDALLGRAKLYCGGADQQLRSDIVLMWTEVMVMLDAGPSVVAVA